MNTQYKSPVERLKEFRLLRNYTQEYMANRLGFSQKAYSKLENNETRISIDLLQRISEILDYPVHAFFDSSAKPVLNDHSTSRSGDNVIYKNGSTDKIEELYRKLLDSKDAIIAAKDAEIVRLNALLHRRGEDSGG